MKKIKLLIFFIVFISMIEIIEGDYVALDWKSTTCAAGTQCGGCYHDYKEVYTCNDIGSSCNCDGRYEHGCNDYNACGGYSYPTVCSCKITCKCDTHDCEDYNWECGTGTWWCGGSDYASSPCRGTLSCGDCSEKDGYYSCSGNSRVYRDYYCSSGNCNSYSTSYSACGTTTCPATTYSLSGNVCTKNTYPSTCQKTCSGGNCVACTCTSTPSTYLTATTCHYITGCSGTTPGSLAHLDDYTSCGGNSICLSGVCTARYSLTVTKSIPDAATVTSVPSRIDCGSTCSRLFISGTSVNLTAALNPGYNITGVTVCNPTSSNTCTVTMNGAKSVGIQFTPTYSFSLSKTGIPASGTVSSDLAGVICGTSCSTYSATYNSGTSFSLTATAQPGYYFSGWSGGICSGTAACSVTMNGAKSVTANFIPTYSLTVIKAGTGSGTVDSTSSPTQATQINCGSTCPSTSVTFNNGTSVTLTAIPSSGYYFSAWGGACSGTTTCTVSMTAIKSVTATFMPLYNLTVTKSGTGSGNVTSSPSGISCGSTCISTYNSSTPITLTAKPNPGSYFVGWSGEICSGTITTCSFSMDSAKSVTATFMPLYNLTVIKAGTGSGTVNSTSSPTQAVQINCGATCIATYNSGTSVTLTATASPGSYFSAWSGACSGTGQCVVPMDIAKSVTATFMPLYNLTVSKRGAISASTITSNVSGIDCGSTCSSKYNSGTSIQLTGTLSLGYGLTWTNGCDSINGNNCTVLMSSNKTVNVTLIQFSCNSSSPSGAGVILYNGTANQTNQSWIYDDISPYSNCSWRCDSANEYVRDGDSCIIIPTENCTNSIDDDGDTKIDWADSDCKIQVINLFILDGFVIR